MKLPASLDRKQLLWEFMERGNFFPPCESYSHSKICKHWTFAMHMLKNNRKRQNFLAWGVNKTLKIPNKVLNSIVYSLFTTELVQAADYICLYLASKHPLWVWCWCPWWDVAASHRWSLGSSSRSWTEFRPHTAAPPGTWPALRSDAIHCHIP